MPSGGPVQQWRFDDLPALGKLHAQQNAGGQGSGLPLGLMIVALVLFILGITAAILAVTLLPALRDAGLL